MKDLFGNKKPIQIEIGEWWFNGRIIQQQTHPMLKPFVSFSDDNSPFVQTHFSFKEAKDYCQHHPCTNPVNFPHNYLGGFICK